MAGSNSKEQKTAARAAAREKRAAEKKAAREARVVAKAEQAEVRAKAQADKAAASEAKSAEKAAAAAAAAAAASSAASVAGTAASSITDGDVAATANGDVFAAACRCQVVRRNGTIQVTLHIASHLAAGSIDDCDVLSSTFKGYATPRNVATVVIGGAAIKYGLNYYKENNAGAQAEREAQLPAHIGERRRE